MGAHHGEAGGGGIWISRGSGYYASGEGLKRGEIRRPVGYAGEISKGVVAGGLEV